MAKMMKENRWLSSSSSVSWFLLATIPVTRLSFLGRVILICVILSHCYDCVSSQECDASGVCDTHERCSIWREEGECYRNKEYMEQYCPISCRKTKEELLEESKKLRQLEEDCEDVHPRCSIWASFGECEENRRDMSKFCGKSCGTCKEAVSAKGYCTDSHRSCSFWAAQGECIVNPNYMLESCRKSCGTCDNITANEQREKQRELETEEEVEQQVSADDGKEEKDDKGSDLVDKSELFGVRQSVRGTSRGITLQNIQETIDYLEGMTTSSGIECKNQHELCSFWASMGECEANKGYMTVNCAPACQSCQLIDIDNRCPPLENPKPALRPGDLNAMFQRIVDTAPGNRTLSTKELRKLQRTQTPTYSVTVFSRPSEEPITEVSAVLDKSLPPWVIVLDHFLTDEECKDIIDIGYQQGYKRSEDVGKLKADGTHTSVQNDRRTSENAWCSSHSGCRSKELPTRIHERIETMLQIPANNSEDFQILRYETGQFYRTHHDYILHQKNRHCGPRILTFFMYLNDVPQGGGTNFPNLDITVMPKKGRALLWPSVYDSNPMEKDNRFMHQALPVEEGTKYAVNGWIHMYDYVTAQDNACN